MTSNKKTAALRRVRPAKNAAAEPRTVKPPANGKHAPRRGRGRLSAPAKDLAVTLMAIPDDLPLGDEVDEVEEVEVEVEAEKDEILDEIEELDLPQDVAEVSEAVPEGDLIPPD